MAKLTLSDLTNLNNQAAAVSAINANNASIEAALENTLSRDGTSPNSMSADLDMNSNQIINVAGPEQNHDAANKEYVDDQIDAALNAYVGPNDIVASAFAQTYLDETTASDTRNVLLPSPTNEYHLQGDGTNSDWQGFTNAGTGAVERGWQTKIREGWISVKDFGATGDGVTDDLAAINLAIAACPDAGGVVFFPPGTYRITNTLTIGDGTSATRSTKQNISLIGSTLAGTFDRTEINNAGSELDKGPSIIKFDGTLATTNAVSTGGPGTVHISNLVIDANAKALIGLEVMHNWNSTFSNLSIINWRTYGLYLSCYGNSPIADDVVIGCMDNTFDHIRVSKAATATGHASSGHAALLVGRAVDDATYGYPNLDVARNIFNKCTFTCLDDALNSSIVLRYCDLNTFNDCFLYAETKSGASPTASIPIRMLSANNVPPASNSFPSGNHFNNCPAVGSATTAISSDWYSSPTNNGNLWFLPHTDEVGGAPAWPSNPRYGGIFGFAHSGHWLAPQIGVRLGNLIDGTTPSTLYRNMTQQTLVSSTTETDIMNRQIPAYLMQNYLCSAYGTHAKDRQIHVRIKGRYVNNSGVSETVTFKAYYGATTIMNVPAAISTNANNRTVTIDLYLTARGNNAAQQWSDFNVKFGGPVASPGDAAVIAAEYTGGHAAITENSETPLVLRVTCKHTTNSAQIYFLTDTVTMQLV